MVLILYSTKTYFTEWFHYTTKKICHYILLNSLWALKILKTIMLLFRYWVPVSVRFRFGKKSIFRFRSGFGEIPFRSFTRMDPCMMLFMKEDLVFCLYPGGIISYLISVKTEIRKGTYKKRSFHFTKNHVAWCRKGKNSFVGCAASSLIPFKVKSMLFVYGL